MATPISRSQKSEAIVDGLIRARELHHTKDHDIATAIKIALNNAGYKIIHKRSSKK